MTPIKPPSAVVLAILMSLTAVGVAQTPATTTTAPSGGVVAPDPTAAIAVMRQELVDAFNKGDLDRLLSHLDDDVIVTWQNGEVSRGPQQVREYYNKMMTGPDKRVESVTADPKVDDRHVYGDWAVSYGSMHDSFKLVDAGDMSFNSRFTATLAKRGDVWKVTSFHASLNAFDNPILRMAAKKSAGLGMTFGLIVGCVVGIVLTLIIKRRRAPASPPPAM